MKYTLDPEMAAMAARRAGTPPMREVGVEAIRAAMESMPRQPGPEMHSVEDLDVDGPHGPLLIRHYRPTSHSTLPALVYFHGGGMVLGTVDGYDTTARYLAHHSGAAVFSVDYRLAPEYVYPVAHDEAWEAVLWVSRHAASLRIDASRLGVAGDSAGGGLAAACALLGRDKGSAVIRLQVLLYPGLERRTDRPSAQDDDGLLMTADDVTWMKNQYLGQDSARDDCYGVPGIAEDLSGLPDAIVVSAEADVLRDGVEVYGERLRAAGNSVTLMRYPGVEHGFMSIPAYSACARSALRDVGALIRSKFAVED